MRKIVLHIFALLIVLRPAMGNTDQEDLFLLLDREIEKRSLYEQEKMKQIDCLKEEAAHAADLNDLYLLNEQLIDAYESYICDSALHYVSRGKELAMQCNNPEWIIRMQLRYGFLLTASGLLWEAVEESKRINRTSIPPHLLPEYYSRMAYLYNELNAYSKDEIFSPGYYRLATAFQDSVFQTIDVDHPQAPYYLCRLWYNCGLYEKYASYFFNQIEQHNDTTHLYAMLAFQLSELYNCRRDSLKRTEYIIRSAIADIRSVTKENYSLTLLSSLLLNGGETDRAYRYIKIALEDANTYNSRQRSMSISRVIPVMEKAYVRDIEKKERYIKVILGFVTLIFLLLIMALFYIYRQMKRYAEAKNAVQSANALLHELNKHLEKTNHIKEEYIGQFLSLCSAYIDKMEGFQRTVNRKLSAGQISELHAMTKGTALIDAELKEFYRNFDISFIRLFPNFVIEFNKLLLPNEQIVLKQGDLMNTELRIFALIRLGITDSSRIAKFLRYSANSIYTYRTKVKNKSFIPRDEFEEKVMLIV